MKSISESPLNKITLALILSLLLAASLWVWLTLPPVQAQGGDEELWRTLDTPFENVGRVLEDKGGNIWAVSLGGYSTVGPVTDTVTITETAQMSAAIQFVEGEGVARFDNGNWVTYTVESTDGGLPSNNIVSAFADSQGNLWFGTYTGESLQGLGVTRFDGRTWQTFIEPSIVVDIEEDDQGGLWFATGLGLSRFTPDGQWKSYTDAEVLGGTTIVDVCRADDGAIWFGASKLDEPGSCLTRYQDGRWYPCEIKDVSFDAVGQLARDKTGHWWVRSYTGITVSSDQADFTASDARRELTVNLQANIATFDGETWQMGGPEESGLSDQPVTKMYQDRDGNLWFVTDNGLIWQEQGNWKASTDGQFRGIVDVFQDTTDHLVWVATTYGLKYYTGYHRQTFNKESGDLGNDHVQDLFEASDGAIWALTWGGGLSRYQDGEWQTFSEESGDLGNDYVQDLFEAGDGAIWVKTQEGLSLYQSGEWQTFDVESGDLGSNNVYDLFEASDGAIWAGTRGGGVSRYQDGKWRTFNVESGDLGSNDVWDLFEASNEAIWALTWGGGLSCYQDSEWQTFSVESSDLRSNYMRGLFEASDRAIWAGTAGGGVSRYQGSKWQTFNVESGDLSSNHVKELFEAKEGAILVETMGAMSLYQDGEWQTFVVRSGDLGSGYAQDLFEASDGAIWVHSQRGVSRYQDGEWQTFSKGSGDLGSDYVQDLFEASDETIWAGTLGGGVSRYQNGEWQTFSKENGDLGSNSVEVLLEASDGAIWAGTLGGGVSRYWDGRWRTFRVESGDLGSNSVEVLLEASDGAIWAGTLGGGVSRYWDGISRYRPGRWRTFSVESGDLGSNDIQDLFEAGDGAVWATTSSGLSCYQDGKWQTFSVESGDLGSNDIQDLFEASDGAIWARTSGGLSRYWDGKWRTFRVESGDLGSNDVLGDLFEAGDGAIWARTSGGLNRYQDGQWQTFSVQSGDLGSNYVWDLFEASDRVVWAGTRGGGMSRYQDGEWQTFSAESGDLGSNDVWDLSETSNGAIWARTNSGLIHYQDGKWQTFTRKEYRTFTEESRPSRQMTDHYGFIWTAMDDGVVRSRPGHRPPWIQLTTVNNIPLTTTVRTLAYDDRRRVSIDFASNDLATRPENLQYLYKLENSPEYADWQQVIYNEPILFEELDPGHYTLLVKAVDEDSDESEPATLGITVESQPEIREVPVEPRYTIPGLGAFTLPQFLGGGIGLGALLGLGGLGVVSWRKWQARRRDIEHNFNPFIGEGVVTEPDMFFGRQEILNDILQNIHATNFAIFGPKRIGKTSLLHQIDHRLSQIEEARFDYLPIVVSLHAVPESRFFRKLMRQIIVGLRAKGRSPAGGLPLQCQQIQPADEPYDGTTFNEDLITLRAALDAQSSLPLRLVLLVDEGDALNRYSQETLAHFREIFVVWAADHLRIVLTAEAKDNREWRLTGSPWFSIFGKQYQLTPFTPEEARQLIEKPVPHYLYQPEAIELILERSQLVPRHIQNICRQAVAEMLKEKTGKITLKHVETALTKVEDLPEESVRAPAPVISYAQAEPLSQQRVAETRTSYDASSKEDAL